MQYINWSPEKNEILKRTRGISFEEIAQLINADKMLAVEDNLGHPHQKMYVFEIHNYAVVVPFVETEDEIFLKTAYPSRKFSRRYGLGGK